jgi:hypothetical protein
MCDPWRNGNTILAKEEKQKQFTNGKVSCRHISSTDTRRHPYDDDRSERLLPIRPRHVPAHSPGVGVRRVDVGRNASGRTAAAGLFSHAHSCPGIA